MRLRNKGRMLVWFIVCSMALVVSGCKDRRAMAEYLTESGKRKVAKGDDKSALGDFTYAIRLDPEYAPPYYHRAEIELDMGSYPSAAGDFRAAAILFEDSNNKAKAYFGEAEAEYRQGHRGKALIAVVKSLELDPDCSNCVHLRGEIYFQTGIYGKALSDLNEVLENSPENTDALYDRAVLMLTLGDYRSVLRDMAKYDEIIGESDLDSLLMNGYAEWGLGDLDAARTMFSEAREKYPDAPGPLIAQAEVALAEKDLDESRRLFSKSIWTGDELPEALLGRCAVEYIGGDYPTAYADCYRASKAYGAQPGCCRARLMAHYALVRRDNPKWARGALEDFLNDGDSVEWRKPLAEYVLGSIDEKTLLEKVRKSGAGRPRFECEARFTIAQTKILSGGELPRSDLLKSLDSCRPFSLEYLVADYQLHAAK